jgi:hypothetical protein
MKKILVLLVLSSCCLAGCNVPGSSNPFVGTWIGHGEKTELNTPPGQTTVSTIDDIVVFGADMTFSLKQGYRQTVDGVLQLPTAYQLGTGTYSYDATYLTMTFDPTSDPGLNSSSPTYVFTDGDTCTIEPPGVFPIVFERVK